VLSIVRVSPRLTQDVPSAQLSFVPLSVGAVGELHKPRTTAVSTDKITRCALTKFKTAYLSVGLPPPPLTPESLLSCAEILVKQSVEDRNSGFGHSVTGAALLDSFYHGCKREIVQGGSVGCSQHTWSTTTGHLRRLIRNNSVPMYLLPSYAFTSLDFGYILRSLPAGAAWFLSFAIVGAFLLSGVRSANMQFTWGDVTSVTETEGSADGEPALYSVGVSLLGFKGVDKSERRPLFLIGRLEREKAPRFLETDAVLYLNLACIEANGFDLLTLVSDAKLRETIACDPVVSFSCHSFGSKLKNAAVALGFPSSGYTMNFHSSLRTGWVFGARTNAALKVVDGDVLQVRRRWNYFGGGIIECWNYLVFCTSHTSWAGHG